MADDPTAELSLLEREAQAWLVRFAAGEASAADLQELRRWSAQSPAHAAAFARASRLWQALGPAGAPLRRARRQPAVFAPASRRIGRRAALGGAFAAAAAAYVAVRPPLSLWPSLSELAADYRTATGEQRRIAVGQDIALDLNTQTSIALRPSAGGSARIELIAGEAAISTLSRASGRVAVLAAGGQAVAARARFNMRYDGTTVCVSCLEGEVRVEHRDAAVSLPADRQVSYSQQGLGQVSSIDSEVVTAWQDGVIVFRETPLAQAVEEINRYRKGRIVLANAELGRRLFNARFRIASIDGVVEQIREVFGAQLTTLPGGIVVMS